MIKNSYIPPTQFMNRFLYINIAGIIALLAGGILSPERVWGNLLIVSYFLLMLGVGGTLLIALEYISGARWSTSFRRIPEAMSGIIPWAGLLILGVLYFRLDEYAWTADDPANPGTFWFKQLWLQPTFFMGRAIGYIVIWTLLSKAIVGISRKQDRVGGAKLSSRNRGLSALFLVIYSLTFTLASCDWFMSLEPMWFSTMWGVYAFSGMMQISLSVVILTGLHFRRQHVLVKAFSNKKLHDLGQLLIGFCCFWMYIWFSQYMLIWYSNIPEETMYFIPRLKGGWGALMLANIAINWLITFLVLLPKPSKKNPYIMSKIAIVVLIGRWLDLYIMTFPSLHKGEPVFGLVEAGAIAILVGTFGLLFFKSFSKANPVPLNDPAMKHNMHSHAVH